MSLLIFIFKGVIFIITTGFLFSRECRENKFFFLVASIFAILSGITLFSDLDFSHSYSGFHLFAPGKITTRVQDVEYFDSVSGHPKVWYYKTKFGVYELFNGAGHHPGTGIELLPINKHVITDIIEKAPKNCFMFNGERICE